jgi:hypothetical protein
LTVAAQTTKGKNMKLREILKITEVLTGRKTPCDILEFLDDEYYSMSGNTFIKYGDLDLCHYIRSNNKEFRELDINKSELEKFKELKTLILKTTN